MQEKTSSSSKTKSKKKSPDKSAKPALSEMDIAEKQAQKMMRDMSRLQKTQSKGVDAKDVREGVDIWKDTDFYFSVVFQSAAQKYAFIEQLSKKFGLGIDEVRTSEDVYQIFNGLKLAEKLGFTIPTEKPPEYVYPNLALKELALDGEEF